MKLSAFVFIFFLFVGFENVKAIVPLQEINKTTYYQVLKTGSLKDINDELALIETSSLKNKDAFVGALMMKKAGLVKVPKEKLKTFKEGATKLETVLRADTSNVEYRFLRLIIQEHAPKIVKYSKNVLEDAALIKKNYKALSPEVQKILIDYSQTSTALKPADFS